MVLGFIIGIHQSIYYGVATSYWLFMLSSLAFLWLNQRLRKKKEISEKETGPNQNPDPKKGQSKKKNG